MKQELKYSLLIALSYLVFSIVWILYSDQILSSTLTNTEQFRELESKKSIIYVLVSAVFIFAIVLVNYRRYKRFQGKYIEIYQEEDRIFSDFPIGMAVVDPKGRFVKVNRSLTDLLGFSKVELLKMNCLEICQIEPGETNNDFLERVKQEPDRAFHINKRLRVKDAHPIWCHLSIILMQTKAHEDKYFVINFQDVDRELKMQNKVIKLNHDLLEAQRLGRFGHWSYHFENNQAKVSEQAATILQLDTEEPEPEAILSLFDDETRQNITERVDKLTTEGGHLHSVSSIQHASGEVIYIEIQAEVLNDSETDALLLKGTIKDISQTMKLQIEREKFNKYLVNWAFKLSHELRQPVSSILGLTQLMKEDLVKDEEREKYTVFLAQAAAELDDQTRDLAAQFQRMQDLLNAGGADLEAIEKINEVTSVKSKDVNNQVA